MVASILLLFLALSVTTVNGFNYTGAPFVLNTDFSKSVVTATEAEAVSSFGFSVSINDHVMVVGAPRASNANGSRVGNAQVYRYNVNDTNWNWEAELMASDGAKGNLFGRAVAVFGHYIAIGASDADHNGINSGVVYIYKWEGGAWVEKETLVPSDMSAHARFGLSLSFDKDILAVGSAGSSETGAVYIFARQPDGTWLEEYKLMASDASAGAMMGRSVSIDHSGFLVAGAPSANGVGASGEGAAYVFRRVGSITGFTWTQDAKLVAPAGAAGDQFGFDVALNGTTALIGARFSTPSGGASKAGQAFVFRGLLGWTGSTWTLEQTLVASDAEENDYFGWSVALAGEIYRTVAIVGSPRSDGTEQSVGSVYLFGQDPPMNNALGTPGTFVELAAIADPAAGKGDVLGFDVDGTEHSFVAGQPYKNGLEGAACVFK